MYDIVHDFAQFLKKTKSQDVDGSVKAKENWSIQAKVHNEAHWEFDSVEASGLESQFSSRRDSKFPGWISSSLNHLKVSRCDYISSLPCLGKFPEFSLEGMGGLKFVGREFLGIAGIPIINGSSGVVISFPKLKKLTFKLCSD
ncbi:hypothetical protein Salat_1561900 [Sesamum alatum]|uniref:Uncharacterized protein n=1 Tax=Sesamum alatum TaxID=300844 RepID=A0AAE1YCY3_9LAMI|nr:hypothetical protein Salat_1561900 [Sesamum alatum]